MVDLFSKGSRFRDIDKAVKGLSHGRMSSVFHSRFRRRKPQNFPLGDWKCAFNLHGEYLGKHDSGISHLN